MTALFKKHTLSKKKFGLGFTPKNFGSHSCSGGTSSISLGFVVLMSTTKPKEMELVPPLQLCEPKFLGVNPNPNFFLESVCFLNKAVICASREAHMTALLKNTETIEKHHFRDMTLEVQMVKI